MKTHLIACMVKVKTECNGTHCYVALFPKTIDAIMDACERFHLCGAFSVTVRPMR